MILWWYAPSSSIGVYGETRIRTSSIHANTSVSRHKSVGDFEIQNTSPMVPVPRHKPASDLEHRVVISADDDLHDFKQVLSDDDELAASTVTLATVRSKDFDGANADLCVSTEGSS